LLKPGWLAATLAVIVFAVACYTLLAPWQFRRHAERKATNDAITSSFSATPVPLPEVLGSSRNAQWRLVSATGSYLPDGEALARLRTVEGAPAFEVLTPFRLTDGRIVLVNRGYLRPVAGTRVPEYPAAPAGRADRSRRRAVARSAAPRRPAFSDASTDGHRQVYAINSATVGRAAGLTVEPGYLQLERGSPGVLGPLPLPELDAGPFLSYALQWLAFGTMALLALGYFTWREARPGGALAAPRPSAPQRTRRKSVAELVAEEEARERTARRPHSERSS